MPWFLTFLCKLLRSIVHVLTVFIHDSVVDNVQEGDAVGEGWQRRRRFHREAGPAAREGRHHH